MATQKNIFTRVQSPDPKFSGVINDIYDKLAQLTPVAPSPTPVPPTPTPVVPVFPGGGGGGGGGSSTSYAFTDIPDLPSVPSNNPTTGAPYAVDGVVVQVNKELWRYSGAPIYQWLLAATATQIITDTHANRVLNFPAASYPNAYFLESDTLILLESNSLTWRTIAGEVQDTHANRLTTWPSVQYSVNTPFYETDRTVTYTVQNATGTVTVAGGVNVTWTAGNKFINTGTGFNAAQWPSGTPIVIAGVTYAVSVVNSATSLTLVSAAVNGAGQAYSVASGRWVYITGRMENQWSTLPADLGENDATTVSTALTLGFLFFDSKDSYHEWQWTGSIWSWGPDNDCQSGTIIMRDTAPDPLTGWHAADGTTNLTKYAKDGTRSTTFTVPDMREFYLKASATYTGSGAVAVAPTASGGAVQNTDLHPTTSTFTPVALATTAVTGFDNPHGHGFTQPTISATGTPATFAVLPYYRL